MKLAAIQSLSHTRVRVHEPPEQHRHDRRGFTLVEMLVAIIILTLATSIVVVGISAGVKTHEESVFVSESDMLASTINEALADPCRFYDPKADKLVYRDEDSGTVYGPSLTLVDGEIYITGSSDSAKTTNRSIALLNAGAYTDCQVVATGSEGAELPSGTNETNTTLAVSFGEGSVSGCYKIKSRTNSKLERATLYSFSFKPIYPITKAE